MAKFYVQCGPVRIVLSADGTEQAAMSALDRVLHPHLWIYDDAGLSLDDCRTHLMLEALMHLPPTIRVSEQGFDRDDAAVVGTPETIDRWHRLMVGMNRLFVAADLVARPLSALAGDQPCGDPPPRQPR